MIVGQISDLHIAPPGSKADLRFRTAEHLARAVEHIGKLEPRPDLWLATGDLVEEGSAEEYQRLRDILAPIDRPIYVIPGNHDEREAMRAAFGDGGYLPPENGAFLQYTLEDYPLRLIALDTLLPGKSRGELCDERLAWLEARLAEAPERPTLIFMHHPPFRTGLWHMDKQRVTTADRLGEVVSRHKQIIQIVCGHLHRPIQHLWHGVLVSVCPSTAHQIALDLRDGERLAVIAEPPALQLHVWFEDEGLVSHTSYIGTEAEPEYMYPEN
jgi:3',5'-cyclic AMP phosphodiesterase CpdA